MGVRAATAPGMDTWPLWRNGDGGLADALGGDLAAGRGRSLVLPAAPDWPSVAREWALEALLAAGIAVEEGPVHGDEDELLLIGLPFGVLPIAELDGRGAVRSRPAGGTARPSTRDQLRCRPRRPGGGARDGRSRGAR